MLYNKIFLSLAGNKDESKAIEETMRIVMALDADLTVIHINDPAAGKTHMMMDTLPEVTEEGLADLFISYAKAIATATREADLFIDVNIAPSGHAVAHAGSAQCRHAMEREAFFTCGYDPFQTLSTRRYRIP